MRIHGVGVDIVEVSRIARLLGRGSFVHRWFGEDEFERCARAPEPARAYAGLLAAKEAAWKSLGIEWELGVPWRWVLVAPDGSVHLEGAVARVARAAGVGSTLVAGVSETPRPGSLVPARGVSLTPVIGMVMACAVSYRR